MTRIWKQLHTGTVAPGYRESECVTGHRIGDSGLVPRYDILVCVASFTFTFSSVRQLRACLSYYEQKTHPSSVIAEDKLVSEFGPDWRSERGWEIERWFERLPMYLLEKPKRQKVVQALTKALKMAESGKL